MATFRMTANKLWLLALGVVAQGVRADVLTLPEAVAIAQSHSFDIRVAEAAIRQAQADVRSTAVLPNPTLSVMAGPSIPCIGTQCYDGSPLINAQLSDSGLLFQLLVGKRRTRERAALSAVEAAKWNRADAQRQAILLVEQQYVNAVVAGRQVAFAREILASLERSSRLMNEKYRAGSVDEADVSRVDIQRLEAAQALDANVQNEFQQRALLRLLLGMPASTKVAWTLSETEVFPPRQVIAADALALDALLDAAAASRPDMRAQEALVAQADATLVSVNRQRAPDIALQVGYGQQGINPLPSGPPALSFGLGIPIPAYLYAGEIARAQAQRDLARIQLERARAQVRNDVEAALAAYLSAWAQVRRMDSELLGTAGRARELVTLQFEKGAASLLEFLDAQRTFIAINVEYLGVVRAYWAAAFQLEAAVGKELFN